MVPIKIGNKNVYIVDTPGFDDWERTDTEILEEIAKILSAQYALGVELKGIIYVHRITDVRYSRGGVKTFDVFKKICGTEAMGNVLLMTSRWDDKGFDAALGAQREQELRDQFWAYMLENGSTIGRFHGDRDSALALASQLLYKKPVVLDLQRELMDENKSLRETAAGAYLNENLADMKTKYEEGLAALEDLKRKLKQDQIQMKIRVEKDLAAERARLQKAARQQAELDKAVGSQVKEEIGKKRRAAGTTLLAFLPAVIGILSFFVPIPPGVAEFLMGGA